MKSKVKCVTANLVLSSSPMLTQFRFLPLEPNQGGPKGGEIHFESAFAIFTEKSEAFSVGREYDITLEIK